MECSFQLRRGEGDRVAKLRLVETSLDGLLDKLEAEACNVDRLPYSHNIVSLILRQIAKRFGRHEANRAIEDFDLEDLGWAKEKEDD